MREYYVYIMASHRGTLYIGVTNDLTRRVYEHRNKVAPGFTAKYNVSKLVYFESSDYVAAAIAREKQIKAWRRSKKVTLLENANLYWDDLAVNGLPTPRPQTPRCARGDILGAVHRNILELIFGLCRSAKCHSDRREESGDRRDRATPDSRSP